MRVAVIGAGIVGVSAAEWLRRDGHDVILIDRVAPGDTGQTSYGNAGILAGASAVPLPGPGMVWTGLRMALSREGPLWLRWRDLPRLAPWLIAFLRAGQAHPRRRSAAALATLVHDTMDQHRALSAGTRAERHLRDGPYVYLHPDRETAEQETESAFREALGFRLERMDRAALSAADPGHGPAAGFGIAVPDQGWIDDPGRYVADLAAHFGAEGGQEVRATVTDIRTAGEGVAVLTGAGSIRADRAILAAGVWSGALVRRLGIRVPLAPERGYHLWLDGASWHPPNPYLWTGFAITPMSGGLRLAGLEEFAALDAPARAAPLAYLRRAVRKLCPSITWTGERAWLGQRPSLPDSLPMIGPLGDGRVIAAFGAHHIGLTTGPKTGRLVAGIVGGERPNIDLAPFGADRFRRS